MNSPWNRWPVWSVESCLMTRTRMVPWDFPLSSLIEPSRSWPSLNRCLNQGARFKPPPSHIVAERVIPLQSPGVRCWDTQRLLECKRLKSCIKDITTLFATPSINYDPSSAPLAIIYIFLILLDHLDVDSETTKMNLSLEGNFHERTKNAERIWKMENTRHMPIAPIARNLASFLQNVGLVWAHLICSSEARTIAAIAFVFLCARRCNPCSPISFDNHTHQCGEVLSLRNESGVAERKRRRWGSWRASNVHVQIKKRKTNAW